MALWFPLRVNLTQIGHFEAQRIENGSIPDGGTVADALARAADLAQHAESVGFDRYWVAEHHGMTGIASAATAVVIVWGIRTNRWAS